MASHTLLTTRSAAVAGITRHVLNGSRWRPVMRGVWAPHDLEITREVMVEAARLVLPVDAVLCGLFAASEYAVDVRAIEDQVVHVAIDGQVARRRPGLSLRQVALSPDEVTNRGRWLVTTPLRTAFDCGRWLSVVESVVVIDAMAHAGLIDFAGLAAFAKDHPRTRGLWQVLAAVDLADPLSESPMETRLRLILIFALLPRPVSQLNVFDRTGGFIARLDLAYEAAKVAVEYDGADHWTQRRHDDRRRDALRELGWTVLVFSADDVYRQPLVVARRVESALRRAQAS